MQYDEKNQWYLCSKLGIQKQQKRKLNNEGSTNLDTCWICDEFIERSIEWIPGK